MASRRASVAFFACALFLLPVVAAAPPWDEINDIQWCVDQTSRTVQNAVRAYAAYVADTYDANYHSIKCKLHQRPPIEITGYVTGTPETRLAQYGIVRGTGSAGDPFVIENWEIAGSDAVTVHTGVAGSVTTPAVPEYGAAFSAGIRIKMPESANWQQHFVIRKVFVHGFDTGIRIDAEYPPMVTIEGSRLVDNEVGVGIYSSSQWWVEGSVTVASNLIRASHVGVDANLWRTNAYIRDNVIEGLTGGEANTWSSHHGIRIQNIYTGEHEYEISRNRISAPSVGIYAYVNGEYGSGNVICATHPFAVIYPERNIGWSRWWC